MGIVKFIKSKNKLGSLQESKTTPDAIYFPTDSTSIIMGGKEYGGQPLTEEQMQAVNSGVTEEWVADVDGQLSGLTSGKADKSDITGMTAAIEGTLGKNATITGLSQTNGRVTASVEKIQIAENQVTNLQTDLANKADKTSIPTKVSQLTNDSGFLTQHQDISGKLNSNGNVTQNGSITIQSGADRKLVLDNTDSFDNKYQRISFRQQGTEYGWLGTIGDNNLKWNNNTVLTASNTYTSDISWGGDNFTGTFGPIDAALVPELGANRLAFVKPQGVSVEYSTDGGETWSDYGMSDEKKIDLFTRTSSLVIGKNTDSTIADKSNLLARVTLTQSNSGVYNVFGKFVIYCGTNTSIGCYCTIEGMLGSNLVSETWTTIVDKQSISGWSGYNVINESISFGYSSNNYNKIRFTFGCTGSSVLNKYYGLTIYSIFGFGGVGWSTPSNMARNGHLYNYDWQQNMSLPAGMKVNGVMTTKAILPAANESYDLGTSNIQYRKVTTNWVGSKTGAHFKFGANWANHGIITTSGNVGIGTTSPSAKLEVNGTVKATKFDGTLYLENATVNAYRNIWFNDSATDGKLNTNGKFQYNPSTDTLKVGNVIGLASKAVADEDGNSIKGSYAKKAEINNLDDRLISTVDDAGTYRTRLRGNIDIIETDEILGEIYPPTMTITDDPFEAKADSNIIVATPTEISLKTYSDYGYSSGEDPANETTISSTAISTKEIKADKITKGGRSVLTTNDILGQLGQDTTKVMSQAAVTSALNQVSSSFATLMVYFDESNDSYYIEGGAEADAIAIITSGKPFNVSVVNESNPDDGTIYLATAAYSQDMGITYETTAFVVDMSILGFKFLKITCDTMDTTVSFVSNFGLLS